LIKSSAEDGVFLLMLRIFYFIFNISETYLRMFVLMEITKIVNGIAQPIGAYGYVVFYLICCILFNLFVFNYIETPLDIHETSA